MCGATVIADGPHPQTPTQALAALPTGSNPLRFFNQHGDANGGAGSTVKGNVCKQPCTTSNNGMDAKASWYNASHDNAGSASAVCLLSAQSLREALGKNTQPSLWRVSSRADSMLLCRALVGSGSCAERVDGAGQGGASPSARSTPASEAPRSSPGLRPPARCMCSTSSLCCR
jgi:hypothetical protein